MSLIESIPHDDTAQKIVELRLSRAPVNALNPALCEAVTRSVDAAVAQGAEGLLLTSAPREGGTAVFSAGIDVPHLLTLNNDRAALHAAWDAFMQAARSLASSPVPVAVGIAGHAFITTALLAASFVYYRDMNVWLQTVFEKLQPKQGAPIQRV